ncbi:hypothetical protein HPB50_020185 [Hyalomma asiaticum]|uniref:Uncharacterized protein n=1 Tax=Hyalomma asiaticum TaxID=266040 RepID=A0ACB7TKL6_HYAAI|nr:hypothetical protein HPB50_020185 [Hyalomma asiaticum]
MPSSNSSQFLIAVLHTWAVLALVSTKTEALMVRPGKGARCSVAQVHLGDARILWRLGVTYLALRIDYRLSWLPRRSTLRSAPCTRLSSPAISPAVTAYVTHGEAVHPLPTGSWKHPSHWHIAYPTATPTSHPSVYRASRSRQVPLRYMCNGASCHLNDARAPCKAPAFLWMAVILDMGSSTAACIAPSLQNTCCLPVHASSTAAETVGLYLTIDLLAKEPPRTPVAVYCEGSAARNATTWEHY